MWWHRLNWICLQLSHHSLNYFCYKFFAFFRSLSLSFISFRFISFQFSFHFPSSVIENFVVIISNTRCALCSIRSLRLNESITFYSVQLIIRKGRKLINLSPPIRTQKSPNRNEYTNEWMHICEERKREKKNLINILINTK